MKIISVNVNHGCPNDEKRRRFHKWIKNEDPSYIFCQESCRRRDGRWAEQVEVPGYVLLNANTPVEDEQPRVACYRRDDAPPAKVKRHDPRWQEMEASNFTAHNVYFPSNSDSRDGRLRIEFLEQLMFRVQSTHSALILGDFNLAPTPEDYQKPPKLGLEEPRVSNLKRKKERRNEYANADIYKTFNELLETGDLYDALKPSQLDRPLYTYENSVFRCDLALVSCALRLKVRHRYEHGTRDCKREIEAGRWSRGEVMPFTNHSAIVLCLDL